VQFILCYAKGGSSTKCLIKHFKSKHRILM